MAAESKTGCFLNFPKKSLSGPALPPPPPPGGGLGCARRRRGRG